MRQAKIEIEPEATPCFCKTHTLHYVMRDTVEEEIDRLLAESIVEPVESVHSSCA